MRISDWSSDVCSSDLGAKDARLGLRPESNKTGTDRAAARAERQGRTMDFRETDRVETSDVATAELTRTEAETPVESTAGVKAKLNGDVEPTVHARRFAVETDASRDALLTDFGKETLQDRYLQIGRAHVLTPVPNAQ